MVGRGLLLHARAGEGADGVQFDSPGVQPPAGVEPRRDAAAAGRPGLRCAGRRVVMRAASGQPS
jgi:hypothetical protein